VTCYSSWTLVQSVVWVWPAYLQKGSLEYKQSSSIGTRVRKEVEQIAYLLKLEIWGIVVIHMSLPGLKSVGYGRKSLCLQKVVFFSFK